MDKYIAICDTGSALQRCIKLKANNVDEAKIIFYTIGICKNIRLKESRQYDSNKNETILDYISMYRIL